MSGAADGAGGPEGWAESSVTVAAGPAAMPEPLPPPPAASPAVFADAETGLVSRALFMDRLEHARHRVARAAPMTLVLLTVDEPAAGDAAWPQAVARRLRAVTRDQDTVARLGPRAFAVLLERGADSADAAAVRDRLVRALATAGAGVQAVRVGLTPVHAGDATEDLLARAAAAQDVAAQDVAAQDVAAQDVAGEAESPGAESPDAVPEPYRTPTSSMRKTSTALGGMSGPAPAAP